MTSRELTYFFTEEAKANGYLTGNANYSADAEGNITLSRITAYTANDVFELDPVSFRESLEQYIIDNPVPLENSEPVNTKYRAVI